MPIPAPNPGEDKDDYISRMMHELKDEFPQKEQRLAVAFGRWRKKESYEFTSNEAAPTVMPVPKHLQEYLRIPRDEHGRTKKEEKDAVMAKAEDPNEDLLTQKKSPKV